MAASSVYYDLADDGRHFRKCARSSNHCGMEAGATRIAEIGD
jgi:hypothetical protein